MTAVCAFCRAPLGPPDPAARFSYDDVAVTLCLPCEPPARRLRRYNGTGSLALQKAAGQLAALTRPHGPAHRGAQSERPCQPCLRLPNRGLCPAPLSIGSSAPQGGVFLSPCCVSHPRFSPFPRPETPLRLSALSSRPAMPRLPGAKQKRQICCNLSFLSHGIYKAACAAVGGLFFMAVSYRAFVAAVCPCYEPSLRRFGVCLRFLRRHGLHAAQAVVFDGPLHGLLAAQDQPPAILPTAAPLSGCRLYRHA